MSGVNTVAFSVFVILFVLVTAIGFAAARWRRAEDMLHLNEWGLGGRGFGTLERPAIGCTGACRNRAQARSLMIIGLPQSMIIEVSRACRAIMPARASLGRVPCTA